jgi:hypothetical protein
MQPQDNTGIHTTGACTGAQNFTVTGTSGTMNSVSTRMEDECAATVVMHWQWQVGTTKNELTLWHMADLMTVQVCIC